MLRDLRIFRWNSTAGKAPASESGDENLPVDPSHPQAYQPGSDPCRPPLLTIQEPEPNPKTLAEQGASLRRRKRDRTPSTSELKCPDSSHQPFRTPEKVAVRQRFGWGPKGDPGVNGVEGTDELSSHSSQLPPLNRGAGYGLHTPRTYRTAGKASSAQSDCSSTQSTPTKSVTKPTNSAFSSSRPPVSVGTRIASSGMASRATPILATPTACVNSAEVPHFELKEDPSFWMDHNVQVVIRVRPLNNTEKSLQGSRRCLKQESAHSITWVGQPETRFMFDYVACETINQEMLFRVAGLPMVENCMSGYNSCVFAYGQTGSGKTYTMLGEFGELEVKPCTNRGMTPRIFEFLFARIKAEEESRIDEKLKYSCKCSFLEIYNEQITDLLDPSSSNLLLREDIRKGVYVENLTEYVVGNVSDILKLLIQGAANRKVAATNMNRESSRSHSVFTCIIESRWEKDSTVNLRFARLNLVDLAGSERQKSSGAEGERLKEAASINRSLSTLGHVIMVLADVAHGKQRHVPYRDSRLTFLLQDSLGGNSKTMIIANVSPSLCSANETLSTLKFAQRARLIQNNAVINEDASGDVIALQHQIRLLKEELSVLKRQNVSRSLSFRTAIFEDSKNEDCKDSAVKKSPEMVEENADELHSDESLDSIRVSMKQLRSLEAILAGALRREKMSDTRSKQLEAEIEQLNRLVRQREEDTQSIKMMLKFREEKIRRMETLLKGQVSIDSHLLEEKHALSEEIQLLRAKVDRNPEVTRFALENIRLLDQLRRFQDFYKEGEREILLAEISDLRNKLMHVFDGKSELDQHFNLDMEFQDKGNPLVHCSFKENESLVLELRKTQSELERCKSELQSCLEINERLTREISNLHMELNNYMSADHVQHVNHEHRITELPELPQIGSQLCENRIESSHEQTLKHTEENLNLQLELDLWKTILAEEKSTREGVEKRAYDTANELKSAKEKYLYVSKQHEDVQKELESARSIIEALESEQIVLINDLDGLREKCNQQEEILKKQEQEVSFVRNQLALRSNELGKLSIGEDIKNIHDRSKETVDSSWNMKLKKMQVSLEKARDLNCRYQSEQVCQTSLEQEMDEARRQVEIETAEVIISLQDELVALQKQADDSKRNESISKKKLTELQNELKELQVRLGLVIQENEKLGELVEEKEGNLRSLTDDWEKLAYEVAEILADGHTSLREATEQVAAISDSLPERNWISEQVGGIIRSVSERDSLIEELQKSLGEAQDIRCDLEWKLRSLRGATLAITEAQMQETGDKEREILQLSSEITEKTSIIKALENRIEVNEEKVKQAVLCVTVAFLTVNKLSQMNEAHLQEIENLKILLEKHRSVISEKDIHFHHQISLHSDLEKEMQTVSMHLKQAQDKIAELQKLSENQAKVMELEQMKKKEKDDVLSVFIEHFSKATRTINDLRSRVSSRQSCISDVSDRAKGYAEMQSLGKRTAVESCISKDQMKIENSQDIAILVPQAVPSFLVASSSNLPTNTNYESTCGNMPAYSHEWQPGILHLREEVEIALRSLQEIQTQMDQLYIENKQLKMSEKLSHASFEKLTGDVLQLKHEITTKEEGFKLGLLQLENKLEAVVKNYVESSSSWRRTKEALDMEISDLKAIEAQKTIETTHFLAKIEEVQGTMQDADVMLNMLLKANEIAKRDIERLQNIEATLCFEKNRLIDEVLHLQICMDTKEKEYNYVVSNFESNLVEAKCLVLELEDCCRNLKTDFTQKFMSLVCDIDWMKFHIQKYIELIRSYLEDTWSEIIKKDCALSVLHLCHMGILIERITGLNMENSFLQHGLCRSSSVIADLSERNVKAKKELEMCSILKGKLLIDINNGFNRIAKKEDETTEFRARLNSFEKKISQLHLQEESMLARSNSMGTELAVLVKEFDDKNRNTQTTMLMQEELLREKERLVRELEDKTRQLSKAQIVQDMFLNSLDLLCHENKFQIGVDIPILCNLSCCDESEQLKKLLDGVESNLIHSFSKEIELLVVASELEQNVLKYNQMAMHIAELEIRCDISSSIVEKTKLEAIVSNVYGGLQNSELHSLQIENENMRNQLHKQYNDHLRITKKLHKNVCSLDASNTCLARDLENKQAELQELLNSHVVVSKELESKTEFCDIQSERTKILKSENDCLRNKLQALVTEKSESLHMLACTLSHGSDLSQSMDQSVNNLFHEIESALLLMARMHQEKIDNTEMASKFVDEIKVLEKFVNNLVTENSFLQSELMHKDEIAKGALFDLRLLQESASIAKDQEDEFQEMADKLESVQDELESRSQELNEAIVHGKELEAELLEKNNELSSFKFELSEKLKMIKLISSDNSELKSHKEQVLITKCFLEEELKGKMLVIGRLEEEILDMSVLVAERNNLVEDFQNEIAKIKEERNCLDAEVLLLKEKLDMAQALAEENEAIATEARQVAEARKAYVEEKEEEVRLLEKSVEELECTVYALENKVDIIKAEAEKQLLEREDIEMELQSVKDQVVQQNVQVLQKEISKRDAEIVQFKAHVSELNMHAEAQAREYKQKFKELEAMAQKVTIDPASSNATNLTSTKSEKNAAKPRGSSSPFKCIGLGLVQQMNSEKDEELTAAKCKIEELESLAANRQKEIFMLNTRLAQAESMTHDVIRDLLGVKLDMTSLLDQPETPKVLDAAQTQNHKCQHKEEDAIKLKKELNGFIEERQSWLHEIKQRHTEMMDARMLAEKLRQKEQFARAENDMLMLENTKYKKMIMELEDELKKLSNQQNLQHRIHHHAKIKEENTLLKRENEDLNVRLKRSEEILYRVKQELTRYRTSLGKGPYIDFDEEEQLRKKLEESEEERIQLAHKLLCLCTLILKVAGLTELTTNVSPSAAEDALYQLENRIKSLENDVEDLNLKCKVLHEKIRLHELQQQFSPQRLKMNEKYLSSNTSQSPCVSSWQECRSATDQ